MTRLTRSQGPPWHAPILEGFDPTQSFSDVDMRVLRRYGVTVVRLGMMWPGVEPQRGQCVPPNAHLHGPFPPNSPHRASCIVPARGLGVLAGTTRPTSALWPASSPSSATTASTLFWAGTRMGCLRRCAGYPVAPHSACADTRAQFCGEGVPLWAAQPRPEAPTFPVPFDQP